jgi:2-dehydro-3-deoxyphosphogluconate aldolase / (4S)-4-hydroxy-2-oxoglutarate aldolase
MPVWPTPSATYVRPYKHFDAADLQIGDSMTTLPAHEEIYRRIQSCGVIAVLVIDDVRHAVPLARALLDGGVDVMELTLRTPAALECLEQIRREVPEMLAGIGTILTPQQVCDSADRGAAFGVAPGTNRRVIEQAQARGLPFMPGVMTPSDLEAALELGCRTVKLFPAELAGGLPYLKALNAPYAHLGVKFIPLGGLTAENMEAYLAEPSVLALGGSWLATRAAIQKADWPTITKNAQAARQSIMRQRGAKNVGYASA